MNKLLAGSIAIAMFLIAGCGTAGEGPPEPGPITSVGAIVGTWQRTSGDSHYIQFFEDGKRNGSSTLENVEDQPIVTDKFWFEGGQLFLEATSLGVCDLNIVGIYEVELLENGNIQFVAIEDECAIRATSLYGRPDDGIIREYEPVP